MKKTRVLLLWLLLCWGLISSAAAETLKMGILPVLDTLPLQVAATEGLFEAQGLTVELVPFNSAMERNTAMLSGQLDGFFGDIPATLLMVKNGVPLKFLTVSYRTDPRQRMFGLMLSPRQTPEPTSLTLSVAISKASVIEYLLDQMRDSPDLAKYRFVPTEIKRMPIRLQMLLAGEMDCALLPEPLATLAETKGARAIASDQTLDLPLTVLNLHADKMGAKAAFLAAYNQAVQNLNMTPQKYRSLMGATCRIPKPLIRSFPVYRYPFPALPTTREVDRVQQWMVAQGLLEAPIDYQTLVH